jgi:tRNA A-37 threonylcarbamoyl transferase component Bud32
LIKAYDGATFRKPNLELVKKVIDGDAYMLESKCGELKLVVTKYFETDWTEEVPLSDVFAGILVQLQCLHKEYGPHGDIRLANMLRKGDGGCLIDFEFVRPDEDAKYLDGFKSLDF